MKHHKNNNQSIMCTSVITPCMLHVDVITPDYITSSQPKSQPHNPILHSKVKMSLWLFKHHCIETYWDADTAEGRINVSYRWKLQYQWERSVW